MNLTEKMTRCMRQAVERNEAPGISLLIARGDEELCYAQAGVADLETGKPLGRDTIFRLYSQSKPITAAAVMMLADRGEIDLMDAVDRYLPGFRSPKVVEANGSVHRIARAPWIIELLSMTGGLCYPDLDPAGHGAARVFQEAEKRIQEGEGMPTVEFANRMGEEPLAFMPGTHWRYSSGADILGAVVEVVSGRRFGDFLREELFEPLGMKDTGFWVPEEKQDRLVSCYKRTGQGLKPHQSLHLAVGRYDRPPAFESGGAGLVSTLDDYMAFARMLMREGRAGDRQLLSPAAVRFMRQPQLTEKVRGDMWDNLGGYNYSCLMRICTHPGQAAHFASMGEFGWDGWLGTYFINLPEEDVTFLQFLNVADTGTSPVTRRCRNLLAAHLSGMKD